LNVRHIRCGAAAGLLCATGAWASAPVAVYPSGSSVPENLLRIEIRLQVPLRAPLDMSHVKLLDGAGRVIEGAFLDLPLPSADGRRLSILLHPGRVKSGVGANLALGRALQAGAAVTLVIDDPAIGPAVSKSWQVTGFDGRRPLPSRWTVISPAAGTRQPLLVRLHSPLSVSSEALIAVKRANGRRLPGRGLLMDGETTWRFTPAQPWQSGAHVLVAHPDLETPEGNRPCAPFEAVEASQIDCDAGFERVFDVRRR